MPVRSLFRKRSARVSVAVVLVIALLVGGPLLSLALGRASMQGDWRTATHRSAGLAPEPATTREAIVQVYAGRTFGWRGAFAVHTWLAAKSEGSAAYTRYEVIGWYARAGRSAVSVSDMRAADAEWYGAAPELVREVRGDAASAVIAKLPQAVASYPYPAQYRVWPGPNSNTFIAHVAREIPELRLAMPSTAIGKDYVPLGESFTRMPSGTGYQFSLLGALGIGAGLAEGLEVNLFGLVLGVDPWPPSLKLPGIGRVPGDVVRQREM